MQNKASRTYREDEVEALETTAMVLAEMIATGELKKITRPGLELDLTRPVTIDGDSYNEGIGLGYVVLHEPRIVVTNLLNENTEKEIRRLAEALGSLRISIDDMLSRRECRWRASIVRCSKPTACSRMTRAGYANSKRRSATA